MHTIHIDKINGEKKNGKNGKIKESERKKNNFLRLLTLIGTSDKQ